MSKPITNLPPTNRFKQRVAEHTVKYLQYIGGTNRGRVLEVKPFRKAPASLDSAMIDENKQIEGNDE